MKNSNELQITEKFPVEIINQINLIKYLTKIMQQHFII